MIACRLRVYTFMRSNFYSVLGLDDFASPTEIEAAYLSVLQRFSTEAAADSKLMLLKKAYEQLSDPIRKGIYDAALKQGNAASFHPSLSAPARSATPRRAEGPAKSFSWRWAGFFGLVLIGGITSLWLPKHSAPKGVPAAATESLVQTQIRDSQHVMSLVDEQQRLRAKLLQLENEQKSISYKLEQAATQLSEDKMTEYAFELLELEMEQHLNQLDEERTQTEERLRAIRDELRQLSG